MESQYGIGIKNRYALFQDVEEDPLEVLKVKEQEKEAKKKTKLSEKENKGKKEIKGKPAPFVRKGIKETQNLKSQDQPKPKEETLKTKPAGRASVAVDRPDRNVKFNAESREERNNRRNRDDKSINNNREERGERPDAVRFERREGGERREFRRDKGERDFRGAERGGEREFRGEKGEREFRGGERADRNERVEREFRGEERGEFRDRGTGDIREQQHSGEGGDSRGRGRGTSGRGVGWSRGRGGGRGGQDGRCKREFDRQSGSDKTGIKAVDKRDGGGAHNWGTHRDDIDDINSTSRPAIDEPQDWAETPLQQPLEATEIKDVGDVSDGLEGEAPSQPVEEEPKELTLDEWKALRGIRRKPQYNLRKAGEGEDLSQWKKMYALQKKKEGEEDDDEDEEYDSAEYPQRVGRQKHVLDIEFHFADTRLGGRGRGGRGGGGRGGPRTDRGGSTARGGSISNIGVGVPAANNLNGVPASSAIGQNFAADPGPRSSTCSQGRDRVEPFPGGRGDHRDRASRQSAPKVDDEHDFPSLG